MSLFRFNAYKKHFSDERPCKTECRLTNENRRLNSRKFMLDWQIKNAKQQLQYTCIRILILVRVY